MVLRCQAKKKKKKRKKKTPAESAKLKCARYTKQCESKVRKPTESDQSS